MPVERPSMADALTPKKASPRHLLGLTLSLCVAIFTCFVSHNLQWRFHHRQETIAKELAILHGHPFL
jgi:hypothetical protein